MMMTMVQTKTNYDETGHHQDRGQDLEMTIMTLYGVVKNINVKSIAGATVAAMIATTGTKRKKKEDTKIANTKIKRSAATKRAAKSTRNNMINQEINRARAMMHPILHLLYRTMKERS